MGEVADYMVANPDWPLKASRSVPNDPSGVPNFSKKSYEALLSWFRKRGLPISNLTIERENSHLKAKLNVLISIHGIDAVRNCVERASIDKEDRI